MQRLFYPAFSVFLFCVTASVLAQVPAGVREGDAALDCAAIAKESAVVAPPSNQRLSSETRGDTNSGGLIGIIAKAAVGAAGAASADKAAAEKKDGQARYAFLRRLSTAKECKADDAAFAGRALTPEEFQQVVQAAATEPAPAAAVPFTTDSIKAALEEQPAIVADFKGLEGDLNLKGLRFYVAEYRLLFEVAGEVTASTRAGYMPGRDYGSSRSRVKYALKQPDIAAFQALTDRAYADFLARLAATGAKPAEPDAFTKENGAVYEATEEGSRPGAPVYLENAGRKYLVMAPTGTKLHSRGFAGLGAGNIGKGIDWSKGALDGISISMAVTMAEHESSGNRSAILQRTAEAGVGTRLAVGQSPDAFFVQGHVKAGGLRMSQRLPVDGQFASFREVGGYDSNKDGVAVAMGVLSNLAGLAKVSNTKTVEAEVELDGPAAARLALKGIASVNQALADKIKAGL